MPPSRGQLTSVDHSKEIRCKVLADDDEARTPANYEAATGAPTALGEQVAGDPIIHQAHQEVTQSGSNINEEIATPFTIEFCSGTAGLTAQIRKLGCEASFGVDHIWSESTSQKVGLDQRRVPGDGERLVIKPSLPLYPFRHTLWNLLKSKGDTPAWWRAQAPEKRRRARRPQWIVILRPAKS